MIKREMYYEYWNDTAVTTFKEITPYLGNIRHGLSKEFYENGSIYSKRLYKFGKLLNTVYYHRLSNGSILKSNDIHYSEYVKEDEKVVLKEWTGWIDRKILFSEAETKDGVLHGKKIVYGHGDGKINQILKYKDGELNGLSYGFDKQGRNNSTINYRNGVRNGEAVLTGISSFSEYGLTQGSREFSEKPNNFREFVAVYENGEIVELYLSEFERKTARVHESMIEKVNFHTPLP